VTLSDPTKPRTLYAESQGGNMNRVDRISMERKNIRPIPARGEAPYRWNWDTPMQLSPHDPNTLYVAANMVFKSTNRGDSWTTISPDLTAQIDRDTLSIMGVRGRDIAIARNDGVSTYSVIVSFAESEKKAGVFWSGADDGTVYVSRDNGANWTNVSSRFPGLPKGAAVSRVAPSSHEDGTAYVTFDNHRADDFAPYVYITTDFGATFRAITNGIPAGQAVRTITEDLRNPNVLYVGTEFGLFVSLNKGQQWMRVKANLPTVPIAEITLHPRDNDMILATHGRSVWILDDIAAFQQAPTALASAAYLFDIGPAVSFNPGSFRPAFGSPGDRRFWGKNPELGAGITYYLRATASAVSARISDAAGTVVRELSGADFADGLSAGVHRVQWDLRHQPLPDSLVSGGGRIGGAGPFVLPGTYRVALTVDGRDAGTKTVAVSGDPLAEISDADRMQWHDVSLAVHQLQGVAGEARLRVVAIADAFGTLTSLVSEAQTPPAAVRSAVDAVQRDLSPLARQFGVALPGQPAPSGRGGGFGGGGQQIAGQLGQVKGQLMSSTSMPTDIQMRTAREARADLAAAIETINRVIGTTLPAVYQAVGQPQLAPRITPMPALTIAIP